MGLPCESEKISKLPELPLLLFESKFRIRKKDNRRIISTMDFVGLFTVNSIAEDVLGIGIEPVLCPREDSNLYGNNSHRILNPARLPIPSRGRVIGR